jgi:hypothetical protein
MENGQVTSDLWVEPDHGWRVVEQRGVTPTGTFHTRVTYGQEVGGVDFPIESHTVSEYTITGPNVPPNFETRAKLKSIRRAEKTEADFRLSAFGLPEPVDVAPLPKRTPRYVWFLIAAGVCAVLAVLSRRLARRRRFADPPPPSAVS